MEEKNIVYTPELIFEKAKAYFSKDRKMIFLTTIIIGVIIHFLLLTNLIGSQDGLMHLLHYSAGTYEASLGRWGIDFFDSLRNNMALPFITTLFSITILSFVNILLIEIFEIKGKLNKFLTVFAFVASPSLCLTLLYVYTADVYFWSLLLAVFTVYSFYNIKNKKLGIPLGIISFIIMLSTYQSYMGITIGLIVMINIKKLFTEEKSVLDVLKDLVLKAVILAGSAIIYYIIAYIIVEIVLNADISTYGGLDKISAISIFGSIIESVKSAYVGFIKYFFADGIIFIRTWNRDILYLILYVLTSIIGVLLFIKDIKSKESKKEVCLRYFVIALLIGVLPLALNIVVVAAPGNQIYYLTSTQMVLMIPFIFMLLELLEDKNHLVNIVNWGIVITIFIILMTYAFSIIVTYQTLEMSFSQAKMAANRIIMKMESVPNYRQGMNTMFVGVIDDLNMPKTLDIYNYALTSSFKGSIFHGTFWGQSGTWDKFMNTYAGIDLNFCTDYEYYKIINSDEFKEMDVFPGESYIKIINDVLVVKFTDDPAKPPITPNMIENGVFHND